MSNVSTNAPIAAGLVDGTARFFANWAKRYEQYSVYRKTLRELSSLNDRELVDLGISRSQIHAIAWDCAYCN